MNAEMFLQVWGEARYCCGVTDQKAGFTCDRKAKRIHITEATAGCSISAFSSSTYIKDTALRLHAHQQCCVACIDVSHLFAAQDLHWLQLVKHCLEVCVCRCMAAPAARQRCHAVSPHGLTRPQQQS